MVITTVVVTGKELCESLGLDKSADDELAEMLGPEDEVPPVEIVPLSSHSEAVTTSVIVTSTGPVGLPETPVLPPEVLVKGTELRVEPLGESREELDDESGVPVPLPTTTVAVELEMTTVSALLVVEALGESPPELGVLVRGGRVKG